MKDGNTIKQAAEEWVDNMFGSGETMGQECFVAGAEWQAEQSGKMFTDEQIGNKASDYMAIQFPPTYFYLPNWTNVENAFYDGYKQALDDLKQDQ